MTKLSVNVNKVALLRNQRPLDIPSVTRAATLSLEAGAHESTGPGPVVGSSKIIAKGTTSFNVTLKAGTYTFFCEVPGHRPAGMYGQLTVK